MLEHALLEGSPCSTCFQCGAIRIRTRELFVEPPIVPMEAIGHRGAGMTVAALPPEFARMILFLSCEDTLIFYAESKEAGVYGPGNSAGGAGGSAVALGGLGIGACQRSTHVRGRWYIPGSGSVALVSRHGVRDFLRR